MSKPYNTIEKQIEILQSRGLVINDINFAKKILLTENYYSIINGYKDLFVDEDNNFSEGTVFCDIYALYSFDRELRNFLIGHLLKFENIIKSVLTNYFCSEYSDEDMPYLNFKNFDKTMNNRTFTIAKLISTFTNTIQQEEKKRGAVYHYLIEYDHVPLWVLKNFMTFGNIQWMYFFVKQSIKDKIARYFAEEYQSNYNENHFFSDETILSILKTTNFFRNICAHEERLYNFRIYRRPSTTQIASILGIGGNLLLEGNMFTLVASLKLVMNKSDYELFILGLQELFIKYENSFNSIEFRTVISTMGLPENWDTILVGQHQN